MHKNRKLYWIVPNPEYMDYLKSIDPRIPDYNYGSEHIKPFYGPLLRMNGLCYVGSVSHYDHHKHDKIAGSLTFHKIYDHEYHRMIAVSNLRYMFPVPEECVRRLDYRDIDQYVYFRSRRDRFNQVNLLKKILYDLNDSNLQERASYIRFLQVHEIKSPQIRGCMDMLRLEEAAYRYQKEEFQEQDITELSEDPVEDRIIKI